MLAAALVGVACPECSSAAEVGAGEGVAEGVWFRVDTGDLGRSPWPSAARAGEALCRKLPCFGRAGDCSAGKFSSSSAMAWAAQHSLFQVCELRMAIEKRAACRIARSSCAFCLRATGEPLIHHESARALGKYPQDVNMRRTDTWAFSEVAGVKPLLCWASREDMESRALATSPPAASSIAFRAVGE